VSRGCNINGSPFARTLFNGCPHLSKLGKSEATALVQNKVTNRQELIEWLAQPGSHQILTKAKGVGLGGITDIYAAADLQVPVEKDPIDELKLAVVEIRKLTAKTNVRMQTLEGRVETLELSQRGHRDNGDALFLHNCDRQGGAK